jgi:hypothetical protein
MEQGQALLLKLEVQVVEVYKNMEVMALKDLEDQVILLLQTHLKEIMVLMYLGTVQMVVVEQLLLEEHRGQIVVVVLLVVQEHQIQF